MLELLFQEVVGFNYQPPIEPDNEVIDEAELRYEDGIFYWADHKGWTLDAFLTGDVDSVWIGGAQLHYRLRPDLLGLVERFP